MREVRIYNGRGNGKTNSRRRVSRVGLWIWRARWELAGLAYRAGCFELARKIHRRAYWAAYAAELGAEWERGERLPDEQEARA